MGVFGVAVESCNLTDSEGDVRSRIGGKIQEHAHDGWIAPGFVERRSVRVRSQWQLCRWGDCWITVGKADCVDDLIDEAALSHVDGSGVWIVNHLDAEEFAEGAFPSQFETSGLKSGDKGVDDVQLW